MSERDFRGGSAHQWTKREETVQRAATATIVHRVAKLVSYRRHSRRCIPAT
jgi:hypothetical protein